MQAELLGTTAAVLVLRTSRLNWQDCPRRVAAEILWGEVEAAGFQLRRRERDHVATVIGSAAHAGDAHLYRELAATGEAGNQRRVERAVEIGLDLWRERVPSGNEADFDEISPDRRTAERAIRRLIETYAPTIDPDEEPLMVEENRAISFHGGQVVLRSTPDRVLVNGKIPDLKTSSRYNPVASAAQLGGQSMVVRRHYPAMQVNWLGIEHQPRRHPDKIGPPVKVEFPQGPAEDLARSSIRQIRRETMEWRESVTAGRPDPGVFPPRPDSFLCSERFCPAFGTSWCSAWRLKVATAKTNIKR